VTVPLYRFKIEDPDDPDRRITGVGNFESKEEAKAELERRQEERSVPYQAPNIEELEAAEKKLGFESLSGRQKTALLLHRQKKPFRVKILGEVK
jgi:hypothetical protein